LGQRHDPKKPPFPPLPLRFKVYGFGYGILYLKSRAMPYITGLAIWIDRMHPPGPFFTPPLPQDDQQNKIVYLIFLALWMIALLYFRHKANSQDNDEQEPE